MTDEQRHALTLLVESMGRGCLKTLLVNAHGLSVETVDGLVSAGYASITFDMVPTDAGELEMARMWITDAGRQALGD